jgi:hypothetical protein
VTGVDFIGALLMGDYDVVQRVPAARIKAGGLPQGIALPAIAVTRVSRVGNDPLRGGASRSVERVQVTVMAPDYDTQTEVLRRILAACEGKAGTIAGAPNVSVTSAGGGPDFRDAEASIWSGSEDFRVSYPS